MRMETELKAMSGSLSYELQGFENELMDFALLGMLVVGKECNEQYGSRSCLWEQIVPCGRAKHDPLLPGSPGLNMEYNISASHFLLLLAELPLAEQTLLVGGRRQRDRVHDMAKETLVMGQTRVQLAV